MRLRLDPRAPTRALGDIQATCERYPGTSSVTLDVEVDGAESHLTLGPEWNVDPYAAEQEFASLESVLEVRLESEDY